MRISDWSSDVCSSDLLGWRWLFAVLFVAAVLAAGLAVSLLQDVGFREARQLDVIGWVLAGMAVVAVVVVTRQAPSWGFTSIPTVLGALVGGASIVLFLRDRKSKRLNSSH